LEASAARNTSAIYINIGIKAFLRVILRKMKKLLKFFNKTLAQFRKSPYLCSEVLRFILG
jgi:hypothetical protein